MTENPKLSVVVPCYNEADNLRPLVAAIHAALKPLGISYEILLTDDFSTDGSWKILAELAAQDSQVRAQRLAKNSGQSAALWAGIQASRGQFIATLDADLQNHPRDLPTLLQGLAQFDCVCGSRVETRRKGDSWVRQVSSRIANWVRNRITNETVSDSGCCYRIFKRECVADLKFFKGMHRFLPTLIRMEGFTVTEVPVSHNPRFAGQSHYGVWNRLFASSYDLFAVRWMQKRMFRFRVQEQLNFDTAPAQPTETARNGNS